MSLRTLYLQSGPGVGGASGLAGRHLYEQLRSRSEDCRLAHRVLPAAVAGEAGGRGAGDSISEELLKESSPNLIYIEGGLFADESGAWKINWPVVEDLVDRGAVLIVADCGTPELSRHRHRYEYAARFLRARPQFTCGGVVYAMDKTSFWQHPTRIVCRTEQMALSGWLRPVYEEVDEILIGQPGRLTGWQDAVVSGNEHSTEVRDPATGQAVGQGGPFVFGSLARCGQGHVVFIAGDVSADIWTRRCPGNTRWLVNLAEFLKCDAEQNRAQTGERPNAPFTLFFSYRSVNQQLVARVARAVRQRGFEICTDGARTFPGDSQLHETSRPVEQMTHFVLFWSRACLGAPWVARELDSAVDLMIERRITLVAVRLDFTPLPEVMRNAFRVEAVGMSPQEIAASLGDAVQRMARHAS